MNDTIIGTMSEWYESGELFKETIFKDGMINKVIEYSNNGKIATEIFFKERDYYGRISNMEYIEIKYGENGRVSSAWVYDRYIDSVSFYEFETKTEIDIPKLAQE